MNGDCNFFPAEFDEHEKCEDELCSESFAAFPHWFEDFWNLDTNFGLSGFPNNSDAEDVRDARLAQNAKLIKHTESHDISNKLRTAGTYNLLLIITL